MRRFFSQQWARLRSLSGPIRLLPRLALADQMDAYETVAGKEAATVGLRLARPHLSREAVAYFDARLTASAGRGYLPQPR